MSIINLIYAMFWSEVAKIAGLFIAVFGIAGVIAWLLCKTAKYYDEH